MYRAIIAIAVMLGAALPSHAGEFTSLANGIFAMSRRSETPVVPGPSPSPTPQPAPSGICDNCNGVGKVGDGTIMLTCPVCNGTGKKPAVKDEGPKWPHYPVRRINWSHPRGSLASHLDSGQHAGKFDRAWLNWLEVTSPIELEYLHSADHDGMVDWKYAVPGPVTEARQSRPVTQKEAPVYRGCPAGTVCPTNQSRGVFGGLFRRNK